MVSGVSFRGSSLDSAKDLIDKPQRYAKPSEQVSNTTLPANVTKKKSVGKTILKVAAAVAVVAGALAAGNKLGGFQKIIDMGAKDGANAVSKVLGKGAGYLNSAGAFIADNCVSLWNSAKGLVGMGK